MASSAGGGTGGKSIESGQKNSRRKYIGSDHPGQPDKSRSEPKGAGHRLTGGRRTREQEGTEGKVKGMKISKLFMLYLVRFIGTQY